MSSLIILIFTQTPPQSSSDLRTWYYTREIIGKLEWYSNLISLCSWCFRQRRVKMWGISRGSSEISSCPGQNFKYFSLSALTHFCRHVVHIFFCSRKKKSSSSRLGYLPVQTLDPENLIPDSPSLSPGRSVSRQVTRIFWLAEWGKGPLQSHWF